MDYLRSCYETDCQFYSDDPRTARIRWYFVPEGTPVLPYANIFTSRVWDEDHIGWDGLGEVYGADRTYFKGGPPPAVAQQGQLPCGTADNFLNGEPGPPAINPVDALGNLVCCPDSSRMRPIAWWRADTLPVLPAGTPVGPWYDSTGHGYALNASSGFGAYIPDPTLAGTLANITAGSGNGALTCSPPVPLGNSYAAYAVMHPGRGFGAVGYTLFGTGWRLTYLVNPDGSSIITWSDPDGSQTLTRPPGAGITSFWSVRVDEGDLRVQNKGVTLYEKVQTLVPFARFGAFASAGNLGGLNPAFTLIETSAVLYELIFLPYAPDADEDLYWTNYLLQKFASIL